MSELQKKILKYGALELISAFVTYILWFKSSLAFVGAILMLYFGIKGLICLYF